MCVCAGLEFSKLTGFPAERLLADPENETYSKLPFKQGALATFFSPKVCPCLPTNPQQQLLDLLVAAKEAAQHADSVPHLPAGVLGMHDVHETCASRSTFDSGVGTAL